MCPAKGASQSEHPFVARARELIEEKTGKGSKQSAKDLADKLGVDYQTFIRWPRGERPIHAHKLALLCKLLDDFSLLDWLEAEAGRVAVPAPQIQGSVEVEDVRAVQRLVKEVGEALQALADTLENHVVEDWELDKTISELDDVIRECVRLKYWVKERNRADNAKRSPGSSSS
jgi:transcriptional regulator with XRE-family HTH domain